MKMISEWRDRLAHWSATLQKDFYTPLGSIAFEGFASTDHLTSEQVSDGSFEPMPVGTPWGSEWSYCWLRGEVVLPAEAENKPIVIDLHPGGESTVFINGQVFGTRRAEWVSVTHHYMVDNLLTQSGRVGDRFELLLEAYAGHYFPESKINYCATGPVIPGDYQDPKAGQLRTAVGDSTYGIWNEEAYQLWLDVQTVTEVMECLPQNSLRANKLAKALQQFTLAVDFEQSAEARVADYKRGRKVLAPALGCTNGSTAPIFYGIGNAHLDVAWLWPLAETERKVARTFAAQLRLLERYPNYRFLQSQPVLYEFCKTHYPELFARIKAAVKNGSWIAEGAMWVEPDTNMTSGESLIRQLVHGMQYFRDELGVDCKILWLPDTFGYTAALPQILRSCGIRYLVTQKIFWSYNEGEQFPYHYFNWRGMDGSEIVSYLPTSYTYKTNPHELIEVWDKRVQNDALDRFLLPFGYGDGGGGPCRDHLEFALREQDLEGCPKLEMAHPKKLFEDLDAAGGPEHTYVGELYFACHRGVYTSQASVKQGNRRSELALREGEMWGALAQAQGDFTYPYADWDVAWKKILLNQFHDILPGSSIARVYDEAKVQHGEAIAFGNQLAKSGVEVLADAGNTLLAFNSLSWEREAVIFLSDGSYTQVTIPACGYSTVIDHQLSPDKAVSVTLDATGAVLENKQLRAVLTPDGEVVSFVLKESGREFAAGTMNRLMLYKDVPRTFDAWDIDSPYEQQFVESGHDARLELVEETTYRCAIKLTKRVGNSDFSQIISLESGSIRLEFDTTVVWHELHRLLKVSFPVAVTATEGINEMQFGYVKRPTHRSRIYDKDRFEVCNHRYTALCDEGHGVAVLNDCKYGVSMLENVISLTLLRAAGSPELASDNGIHHFTYGFTAWEGSMLTSPVVRQGYELNVKPTLHYGKAGVHSYFTIENGDNIILDTVKPAEDGSGDIILRLYESKQAATTCILRLGMPVNGVELCNMLEQSESTQPLQMSGDAVTLGFRAFEVKTVRLALI